LQRSGVDYYGYKAREGRIPQSYLTVRRGIQPSASSLDSHEANPELNEFEKGFFEPQNIKQGMSKYLYPPFFLRSTIHRNRGPCMKTAGPCPVRIRRNVHAETHAPECRNPGTTGILAPQIAKLSGFQS